MKEFAIAAEDAMDAAEGVEEDEKFIEFKLGGREMRAYHPTDGQLAFMMASLGRGQTNDQRFAAIVNIMLSALRDDDADWLESRLLTRNPEERVGLKTLEAIFEHLAEEWFARPTQQPSDSASSPPSSGAN